MAQPLRLAAIAALLATAAHVSPARAGLDACGNIDVEAQATCKAQIEGGCETQCEAVSYELACSGKLQAECSTTCNRLPEVSCTGSCQGDCEAECTVEPARYDCEGSCKLDCEGTCSGKCTAAGNTAECEAQCKATCSGECGVSCEGTPATADCSGKCQASCQGSCKADLNMDCQTDCQAQGFVSCTSELKGGCKIQCKEPEGALFCDGEYVDHGGNAAECISALEAVITSNVDVSGTASGMAQCGNGSCTAEGKAKGSVSCALSPESASHTSYGALAAFGALLGMAGIRRRKGR